MTAFLASLAFVVLAEMGDKTQLLAMAFACRFRWQTVMWGVLVATILNHLFAVLVGNYLTSLIALSTLQIGAAISFIIFGIWTIRGDELGDEAKKDKFSPFWTVAIAFFIAEMGDKTQLMLVAMTSRFKLKDILLGTGVAVLVLNGLAVLAGGIISTVVPTWLIRLIAGAAFLFFAVTTLKGDDDEEENVKDRKIRFAPLSVFCTFFVAELGDKTQLTAITFGANEGLSSAVLVWLACSLGLFAADVIGLLIGYLLKSKAPEGILNTVAFVIFSIFGILTLRQGFGLLLGAGSSMILPLTVAVTVVFVIVCLVLYKQAKKN